MQIGSGFTCASLSDALPPYGSFIGSSTGGRGKTQQVIAGGLIGNDFGQQEGPPISPVDELVKTSEGDITLTEEEPEAMTAEGLGSGDVHTRLSSKDYIRGTNST